MKGTVEGGCSQSTFRKTRCSTKRASWPVNTPLPARVRTTNLGPFGEVLRATGPIARANPFRFSTKFQDDETDLLYYGYRYYSVSAGRWICGDPMEEQGGVNLYVIVSNDPVGSVDELGLYKSGDHEALTKIAFDAVELETTPRCLQRMLKVLVKANVGQDNIGPDGPSFKSERHYNRSVQPQGNVGQKRYAEFGQAADDEYGKYLRYEQDHEWNPGLEAGGKKGCRQALKALGRLSHSWQDFFMHAIRRDGQGGKENSYWPGWTAFSQGKTGTPDARGEFYPSSFSALASGKKSGEHPGWFREPISFSSPEWSPRYQGAREYTTTRFMTMLPEWLARCRCQCEE